MFNKILELIKTNMQFNQTLWLSILLVMGMEFYGLNISYLEVFVTFTTVMLTDFLLMKNETWKIVFPYSWVNAWFWMSFFLSSEDLVLYIFAWLVAIFSKSMFTTLMWNKESHFFNPSNLWVFVTLVLFPYLSWSNPLQWGQWVNGNLYLMAIVLMFLMSMNIEYSLKKMLNFSLLDMLFSLLVTHMLIFYFFTSETMEWAYLFFNWSFWMFLFFMVTDPKTIPWTKEWSLFFWVSISMLFYMLQYFMNENYSLLASLFMMTMFLPLMWRIEYSQSNNINDKNKKKYNFTKLRMLLLTMLLCMVLFFSLLMYYYWKPDLVFNNSCNKLFCSNF